jgi:CxxC motif-containing protein (DUF1111 family)
MRVNHVICNRKPCGENDRKRRFSGGRIADFALTVVAFCGISGTAFAQAIDPGVRPGSVGAGSPLANLSNDETTFFNTGLASFQTQQTVGTGLGPRFNLDSCLGCHSQPAVGGTSGPVNPQVAIATAFGANNIVPSFVQANGPIVEARFKVDTSGVNVAGGVHSLFVTSGRVDSTGNASGCTAVQENFNANYANGNIALRIPLPLFGDGLIESLSDATILANAANPQIGPVGANPPTKAQFGITGHPNRNGNTGTISRFGWKAQNDSLLLFAGEASNVELGVTNELFPNERDDNPTCQTVLPPTATNPTGLLPEPNSGTLVDGFEAATVPQGMSEIQQLAFFMKFLNQVPTSVTLPANPVTGFPGASAVDIVNGRTTFETIGCALCHSVFMVTSPNAQVPALQNVKAVLWSDLLVHHMGPGLADGIPQGLAGPDEFRTATLWGLGQRIFFMHDGRTSNLITAIEAHAGNANGKYVASEANASIAAFNALPATTPAGTGQVLPGQVTSQQDVLDFLRNL